MCTNRPHFKNNDIHSRKIQFSLSDKEIADTLKASLQSKHAKRFLGFFLLVPVGKNVAHFTRVIIQRDTNDAALNFYGILVLREYSFYPDNRWLPRRDDSQSNGKLSSVSWFSRWALKKEFSFFFLFFSQWNRSNTLAVFSCYWVWIDIAPWTTSLMKKKKVSGFHRRDCLPNKKK